MTSKQIKLLKKWSETMQEICDECNESEEFDKAIEDLEWWSNTLEVNVEYIDELVEEYEKTEANKVFCVGGYYSRETIMKKQPIREKEAIYSSDFGIYNLKEAMGFGFVKPVIEEYEECKRWSDEEWDELTFYQQAEKIKSLMDRISVGYMEIFYDRKSAEIYKESIEKSGRVCKDKEE